MADPRLLFDLEQPSGAEPNLFYDYLRQAWVQNGRYLNCHHPASMDCRCWGREHAGDPVERCEYCHMAGTHTNDCVRWGGCVR